MYINFYSIFIFSIIYGLGLEPRFSSVLCCLSSGSQFDCFSDPRSRPWRCGVTAVRPKPTS